MKYLAFVRLGLSMALLGIAVASLCLTLGACQPIDENPGGNKGAPKNEQPNKNENPGAPPGAPGPDFIVHLHATDAKHPHLERVSRIVTCDILGIDANRDIVMITDARTGQTFPYRIQVTENTPKRLLLYNYARVAFIDVKCVMKGNPGDTLSCEFTTGDNLRSAPMVVEDDFGTIPKGGKFTTCSGTIIAHGGNQN